jgi:hypothetical protein
MRSTLLRQAEDHRDDEAGRPLGEWQRTVKRTGARPPPPRRLPARRGCTPSALVERGRIEELIGGSAEDAIRPGPPRPD